MVYVRVKWCREYWEHAPEERLQECHTVARAP